MEVIDTDEPAERAGAEDAFSGLAFILLTLGLMLVGALLGTLLVQALAATWGYDLAALMATLSSDSPVGERQFLRTANLLPHLLSFTMPPLLAAWLVYRRRWLHYLGLNRVLVGHRMYSFGALWLLMAFPFVQLTYWLNKQVPLPAWMKSMEADTENLIKGLMTMASPGEFLFTFFVVAVVPALGEELLFRGVLQQQIARWLKSPVWAVCLTALLFSAFHLQFEGFVPRFLLGLLLGFLFLWSRNLWVPIVAHLFFNGMQVVAQYLYGDELKALDTQAADEANWLSGLLSLALVLWFGRYISSYYQHHHTLQSKPEGT